MKFSEIITLTLVALMLSVTVARAGEAELPVTVTLVKCGETRADLPRACYEDARCCGFVAPQDRLRAPKPKYSTPDTNIITASYVPTPLKKPEIQIKKDTPFIAGLQLAAVTTRTDTTSVMPTRKPAAPKKAVAKAAPEPAPQKTAKTITRTIEMPKTTNLSWRKPAPTEPFDIAENYTYTLE